MNKDYLKKILRQSSIDRESLAIIESHLDDSERLKVIRDAFLEGRDGDAVRLIRELDASRFNQTVLGINSNQMIAPGEYAMVVTRPQLPFQVERFVVSRESTDFMIHGMQVGNVYQFPNSSGVAADIFATDALDEVFKSEVDERGFWTIQINKKTQSRIGIQINMPACLVSQDLVVQVSNEYAIPRYFRGAFLGAIRRDLY